jgi:hypothetical protein
VQPRERDEEVIHSRSKRSAGHGAKISSPEVSIFRLLFFSVNLLIPNETSRCGFVGDKSLCMEKDGAGLAYKMKRAAVPGTAAPGGAATSTGLDLT